MCKRFTRALCESTIFLPVFRDQYKVHYTCSAHSRIATLLKTRVETITAFVMVLLVILGIVLALMETIKSFRDGFSFCRFFLLQESQRLLHLYFTQLSSGINKCCIWTNNYCNDSITSKCRLNSRPTHIYSNCYILALKLHLD